MGAWQQESRPLDRLVQTYLNNNHNRQHLLSYYSVLVYYLSAIIMICFISLGIERIRIHLNNEDKKVMWTETEQNDSSVSLPNE